MLFPKNIYTILILLLITSGKVSFLLASTIPNHQTGEPTIKIIENKGQWESPILFKANIPGGDLYITKNELIYALVNEGELHSVMHKNGPNRTIHGHNYKMLFEGSNASIGISKQNASYETYNYFIGNNKNNWASNCRAYQKIILHNMYDNIDVEIEAKSDYIKINYILKPNANAQNIKLTYTGIDAINLHELALNINTSVATVKEEKPIAFQNNEPVFCAYFLNQNSVSYQLGNYNHQATLIIDPNIIFGTYSGSVADNFGFTGTYDNLGNGYTGGTVFSAGFPVTFGAYQQTFGGGTGYARDIGILKFSSDGKQLLYATYLGGTQNEQPHSIICNAAQELYVLGTSESTNFPVTANAADKTHGGNADIIIAKLSADGTQLLASTFWGGSKDDGINGVNHETYSYDSLSPLTYNYGDFYRGEIKLDKFENVLVASATRSTLLDGYTLKNGFQNTFGGGSQDGCLLKLTPDLSTVVFSSYLGGIGEDAIYGVAIDQLNTIIVTGGTTSSDIGKNNGTYTYKGEADAFVGKINALGSSLQKLIYLGTPEYDQSYFVDIDNSNQIYITGQSMGNFEVKGTVYNTLNGHQFIAMLNNNIDSILFSTVFGNGTSGINLSPSALMVDNCGQVYFSGWGGNVNIGFQPKATNTLGLATTQNAFQQLSDGSDFYLLVLGKNLSALKYASYLGGNSSNDHVDGGTSRFDKNGNIYQAICASCGGTSDLPTTPLAYSRINKGKRPNSNAGGCNNALVKFVTDPSDNAPIVRDSFFQITAGDSVFYSFTIIDPDGDSVNTIVTSSILNLPGNPAILKTTKGKNTVTITIAWRTDCLNSSTDTFVVNIFATDNGCLLSKTATGKVKILVIPPPLLPPPFLECLQTITDSSIHIKWNSIPNAKNFKSYRIYKSINGSVFSLYQNKTLPADSNLLDTLAQNHLTQNVCYYMQTVNSCNIVSAQSRTVCSLFLNDTLNPIFTFTKDTLLHIIATDTLSYIFNVASVNTDDSVYIHKTTGSLLTTNRIIESAITNNKGSAQFAFKWKSICNDALHDTFLLSIIIRDNQCPQSRTKTALIKILVSPPPLFPPPPMQCTRSIDGNKVLVRWGKSTVDKRYFSHYVLIKKNANGTITPLTSNYSADEFSYTDNAALNNETDNICYSAYAVNICNLIGDSSRPVCTVFNNELKPAPIYIHTTTVVDNAKILTTWTKSKESNFLQYKILKQSTLYDRTFSEYMRKADKNDTILIDENVAVQKSSYCYIIKQINDCGLENDDNNLSCSILLTGKSDPFIHHLQWNDYDYWKQGLSEYALLRKEPLTEFEILKKSGYKRVQLKDDQLNTNNGLYYYQVVAQELNSSYVSTSNNVELLQAPLLHVPNAFTPNNDGYNDKWKPVPVFVKEYSLKLFDRWGKLVLETTNKSDSFDGLIQNAVATSDVFVYLITYTGWDGTSKTVSGNITLLR